MKHYFPAINVPTPTGCRVLTLLIALWTGLPIACGQAPTTPPAPAQEWSDTEKWVWSHLLSEQAVALDEYCQNAHPDPRNGNDPRWQSRCRTISSRFLQDLLTRAPWQQAISDVGVWVQGARVVGVLDLENSRLLRAVELMNCRIEGDVTLERSHTDNLIMLAGTFVAGRFSGVGLQSGSDLVLRSDSFAKDVDLSGAKIGGQVVLNGATVAGLLDLESLDARDLLISLDGTQTASLDTVRLTGARIAGQVALVDAKVAGDWEGASLEARELVMRSEGTHQTRFKRVSLADAKVDAEVDFSGVRIEGAIDAQGLEAHDLLMRSDEVHNASFGSVDLTGARIAGQLNLDGATVEDALIGESLGAREVLMRSMAAHKAHFTEVNLKSAKIAGQVSLRGAEVDGKLQGQGLEALDLLLDDASLKDVDLSYARVAGDVDLIGVTMDGRLNGVGLEAQNLYMRSDPNRSSTFAKPVDLATARIVGMLDLRGATLADIDLSSSNVGTFEIGTNGLKQTEWRKKDGDSSTLTLTNAHFGSFADGESAWPAGGHLQLDGFTFSSFGGVQTRGTSVVQRGMDWWDQKWARLDERPSASPYTQLAAALTAMGEPGAASEIRYLGRQRERDTAWRNGQWGTWFGLTLLWVVAGYGIGAYTFIVLVWVGLFTLAGAAVLWFTVPAVRIRRHGPLWCVGASLSRLLPVIEINKEFTDFFHDPDRSRLNTWQFYIFCGVGILGWILGAILVAAMSSLTHNP